MKIYVIKYDGYTYPSAVLSSQENVEKWFKKKNLSRDGYAVEEYELDEGLEEGNKS